MHLLAGVVLLLCLVTQVYAMRKQGVGVSGKLVCGSQILRNVKVKIVDIDSGK
jgi:hypothetical protein